MCGMYYTPHLIYCLFFYFFIIIHSLSPVKRPEQNECSINASFSRTRVTLLWWFLPLFSKIFYVYMRHGRHFSSLVLNKRRGRRKLHQHGFVGNNNVFRDVTNGFRLENIAINLHLRCSETRFLIIFWTLTFTIDAFWPQKLTHSK